MLRRTPLCTPSMGDEEFLVFFFAHGNEIRGFINHLSTRHPYKNDASIAFTRHLLGLTMDTARQEEVVFNVVKYMFLNVWLTEFLAFTEKDTERASVAPLSSAESS
jgi:hypothetical protein